MWLTDQGGSKSAAVIALSAMGLGLSAMRNISSAIGERYLNSNEMDTSAAPVTGVAKETSDTWTSEMPAADNFDAIVASFPLGTVVRAPSYDFLYGRVVGYRLTGWPMIAFEDDNDTSIISVDEAPGDIEVVKWH